MIGILAFTDTGRALAGKVEAALTSESSAEPVDLFRGDRGTAREFIEEHFREYDRFLFIGAAGICVRLIAPYIQKKDRDPAVVVMDELGQFVIPVLSGHIGGGNRFARELAELTGAQPVITTATDLHGKFAADVWAAEGGCRVLNTDAIRYVSGAVLRGDRIGLWRGSFPLEGELPPELADVRTEEDAERYECGVSVSLSGEPEPFAHTMKVVPRIVTLGIGCRRSTPEQSLEHFVERFLAEHHIHLCAVRQIATIELKKEEAALVAFCRRHDVPLRIFSARELMETEGAFHHSDFVEKITGADNICERSCVRAAEGRLLIPRTAENGITMAAAVKDWKCRF